MWCFFIRLYIDKSESKIPHLAIINNVLPVYYVNRASTAIHTTKNHKVPSEISCVWELKASLFLHFIVVIVTLNKLICVFAALLIESMKQKTPYNSFENLAASACHILC